MILQRVKLPLRYTMFCNKVTSGYLVTFNPCQNRNPLDTSHFHVLVFLRHKMKYIHFHVESRDKPESVSKQLSCHFQLFLCHTSALPQKYSPNIKKWVHHNNHSASFTITKFPIAIKRTFWGKFQMLVNEIKTAFTLNFCWIIILVCSCGCLWLSSGYLIELYLVTLLPNSEQINLSYHRHLRSYEKQYYKNLDTAFPGSG